MGRHQRGYIYEASNAFHVRYYANGVQKSHRLCTKDRETGHGSPSAKAVRTLCEDFMREVNADTPNSVTPVSIVQFWNETYLPFIESNLKPSTLHGYKSNWELHLKPHFGNMLLKDYRTGMATKFLTHLAKTLRPRSLRHIKSLGCAIFSHALAIDEAEMNPWRDAKVLGKMLPNGVTQSYTLEEIENVISALVEHVDAQLMMALSYFGGLRKGEIQGLQWGDFDDKFCHVRRAFGRGVLGTPKSLKSVRSVPLIAPVKVFLVLWRAKGTGEGWVFPNAAGNAMCPDYMARWTIRPALQRAGLPWKGYHAGRRGLGTKLRELTGNSNAGRDVLGHSTTQVTEVHYEHTMPEEALRGMKLLEEKVSK